MGERTRRIWEDTNPELRDFLADMAFTDEGQLTPGLTAAITNNAIQDVIEAPQAGQGE